MRTSASEHLSHAQVTARLASTFSALVKEQIDVVRRHLDAGDADPASRELGNIVELAVRLVERSAEWLGVSDVASLAMELREALSNLEQLRASERQEMVAHCRVALDAESKLADRLRTEGFAALVAHAGAMAEAVDQLRAGLSNVKAHDTSRELINEPAADVGPSENLLALTVEIKNALVHQNDRIGAMSETVSATARAAQSVLGEWEAIVKAVERRRVKGGESIEAVFDGKSLLIHQELQETNWGLRTLTHELSQLMSLQYALERRARDLDESLLWEFLDPLDRFMDDLYAAASRRDTASRRSVLTIHTGGVGFEPEIGSILLPLLARLLETAEPADPKMSALELRLTAAREGLEARIALEGPCRFSDDAVRTLESALEHLGGFVTVEQLVPRDTSLRLQFPMARSLRSFLIVESGGQKVALPWSAIERICVSTDDLAWKGEGPVPIFELAQLLGTTPSAAYEAVAPIVAGAGSARPAKEGDGRPLIVLRSGGQAAVIGFDRIVWRENARLSPLPSRLYRVEEILGGIVTPDNAVTLVLNPAGVLRRIAREGESGSAGTAGAPPRP